MPRRGGFIMKLIWRICWSIGNAYIGVVIVTVYLSTGDRMSEGFLWVTGQEK